MIGARPTPYDLVFGAGAAERLGALRAGLEGAGRDPRDRHGFLLVREVAELLRELRPDEGIGAAMEGLVAFVHSAYLFWSGGERVRVLGEAELSRALSERPGAPVDGAPPPAESPTGYIQVPPLRIWGNPVEGQPVEPLDGWFVSRRGDELSVLAIFGVNAAREGFTAVEVSGPPALALKRPDGSALFSPTLSGGAAAGLASVAGAEELLELAWRVEALR